jgi:hypothetical protein
MLLEGSEVPALNRVVEDYVKDVSAKNEIRKVEWNKYVLRKRTRSYEDRGTSDKIDPRRYEVGSFEARGG